MTSTGIDALLNLLAAGLAGVSSALAGAGFALEQFRSAIKSFAAGAFSGPAGGAAYKLASKWETVAPMVSARGDPAATASAFNQIMESLIPGWTQQMGQSVSSFTSFGGAGPGTSGSQGGGTSGTPHGLQQFPE